MNQTTTIELTQREAEVVGGTLIMVCIFALIFYILTVIAGWKIFEKAGEKGWKALIPIYNVYIMYKIVKMQKWFWITLLASFIFGMCCGFAGYDPNLNNFENLSMGGAITVGVAAIVYAIIALYVEITYSIRTARAFGHGVGFAVGLILLPSIFWLIIGFGSSKYNKKYVDKLK